MSRILVTGGAGFLGSHLCDRLLADNNEVVCLDSFLTGSRQNIEHLLEDSKFKLLVQDVVEPIMLDVDRIFNLACPASSVHYQLDPIRTMKTNVLGAANVLELATRCGARVFQASTSEIYGDPVEHPQRESYWGNVNPNGVRACYDEGKRSAEALFFDFNRMHNTDIRVARVFNTYGPRMSAVDGRVVSNFIVQALKGESITLYGDGHQTRSFCYVDDLIEGFVRLMNSPGNTIGPINLGNPSEITVRYLADRILALTGSNSRLVSRPLPSDDPCRRRPDISLAESELGWVPSTSLESGLKSTIEYFDRELSSSI